ncbi:hypothetical protein LDENG_00087720, partial [Lucifuga dentata]
MLSLKKKGGIQILRYSEIHIHFSKIQLFTQIVKMILSFVMKNLVLYSKRKQNRSIFTVVSDFWTPLNILSITYDNMLLEESLLTVI